MQFIQMEILFFYNLDLLQSCPVTDLALLLFLVDIKLPLMKLNTSGTYFPLPAFPLLVLAFKVKNAQRPECAPHSGALGILCILPWTGRF